MHSLTHTRKVQANGSSTPQTQTERDDGCSAAETVSSALTLATARASTLTLMSLSMYLSIDLSIYLSPPASSAGTPVHTQWETASTCTHSHNAREGIYYQTLGKHGPTSEATWWVDEPSAGYARGLCDRSMLRAVSVVWFLLVLFFFSFFFGFLFASLLVFLCRGCSRVAGSVCACLCLGPCLWCVLGAPAAYFAPSCSSYFFSACCSCCSSCRICFLCPFSRSRDAPSYCSLSVIAAAAWSL